MFDLNSVKHDKFPFVYPKYGKSRRAKDRRPVIVVKLGRSNKRQATVLLPAVHFWQRWLAEDSLATFAYCKKCKYIQ